MKTKISKAQIEVWEWKEQLYEDLKHLPMSERLRVIHEETKPIIDEINRKKRERENEAPATV